MEDSKIVQLLSQYNAFLSADENGKLMIYNVYNNIKVQCNLSDYEFENTVKKTLTKPSKNTSYHSIFGIIYEYDYQIKNSLNLETLELLLKNYNNVVLTLPFETCGVEFSFASFIFSKLAKRSKFDVRNLTYNEILNMLKIVIPFLQKHTSILVENSNRLHPINLKFVDVINDDSLDIDKFKEERYHSDREEILTTKIFKLLLENNVQDPTTFPELLTFLYCRQDMCRLTLIKQIKPELLSINLVQLIKIIFYGRNKALEFVIENLPEQFQNIVAQYNPYDIALLKEHGGTKRNMIINYIDDIWNGWNWYNDEHDKPHVGSCNFDEVFRLMSVHSTCVLNEELTKLWLRIVLKHEDDYFIEKEKLIEKLNLNIKTKEGIARMIEVMGYKYTWSILQKEDSNVLKLLLPLDCDDVHTSNIV